MGQGVNEKDKEGREDEKAREEEGREASGKERNEAGKMRTVLNTKSLTVIDRSQVAGVLEIVSSASDMDGHPSELLRVRKRENFLNHVPMRLSLLNAVVIERSLDHHWHAHHD